MMMPMELPPDKLTLFPSSYRKNRISIATQDGGNWCPLLAFFNYLIHDKENSPIFSASFQQYANIEEEEITRGTLINIFIGYGTGICLNVSFFLRCAF
jgi:hypothetical protein